MQVFAITAEETSPGGAAGPDVYIADSERTSAYDLPTSGYWIAEDERGYAYPGGEGTYFGTTGTTPLTISAEEYLTATTKHNALKVEELPSSLGLNGLNEYFKVGGDHEIRYLRFVLEPQVFANGTGVGAQYFASHIPAGGSPTFKVYQEGCIECTSMDDLEGSCNYEMPYDSSCIHLNILDRKDCSAMSDFNQQFCEGVVGIAPNIDIPIGNVGTAGYGGCRLVGVDDTSADEERNFGRDWFSKVAEPASWFSPDFIFASGGRNDVVGGCCGNDLMDDPGAIMRHETPEERFFPDRYICLNSTNDTSVPGGNFLWLDAMSIENFKIYYIQNRTGAKAPYAAVSNSNNWFICNTDNSDGSPNLDDSVYLDLQKNSDQTRRSGVLLNEYEILPKPNVLTASGTEILEGGGEDYGESPGGGTDARGDAGTGHSDSVDEDSFASDINPGSVVGVGRITACDKDGDGYDGPWSSDPIAGSWHDTSSEPCTDPQPPFDCDEGNIEGFSYPADIARTTFARMRHPGRIDYCFPASYCGRTDGDCDLNCDLRATPCISSPGSENLAEDVTANPSAEFMYPRFMCHNVDSSGDFSECCGWSLQFCFNGQQGRREGSPIHTLRDFSYFIGTPREAFNDDELRSRATQNFVLRYGINKAPPPESTVLPSEYYTLPLYSTGNDLKITNWSHYQTLDFYIWFTTNFEVELWLGKRNPGTVEDIIENFMFPYKLRIVDYVVNEPELNKWLHVSIPIEDITMTGFTPDIMIFASNVQRLVDLQNEVTVNVGTVPKTFSNVIGVDKIHFRPKTEQLLDRAADENYFCTGTWPPTWVSDLDSLRLVGGSPAGRDACEAIPSYGWTGTQCCGDDTGENTDSRTIGPATSQEFYADKNAGCWAGNVLANGSRIMLVTYNLSYAGIANRQVRHSCRNESCVYELPPIQNVLVTNGNPEVYKLFIVNGEPRFVGRGALTPDDNSYLRASSVPLQVLFSDEKFWSCNAAKFINVSLNTLIPATNRLTSTGETCSIKAGFFCDHIDGEDSGWNGEGLIRYPGTNITLADGTQMDLGTASSVAAEYRGATKRNYNLIRNGGFENV